MKTILEFNDTDDTTQNVLCAVFAKELFGAMWDMDNAIRNRIKHCDISDDEEKFLQTLRDAMSIMRLIEHET